MSDQAQFQMRIPCLSVTRTDSERPEFWTKGWIIGFTTLEYPEYEYDDQGQQHDTGKVFHVPGAIIKEKNSSLIVTARFMEVMVFENEKEMDLQIEKDKLDIYEKKI